MSKQKAEDGEVVVAERWLDWIDVDELPSAPQNPKRHQAEVIDASIGRHGFVEVPTIDERTGLLVAGHGRRDRLQAMRLSALPDEPAPDGVRETEDGRWLVPVLRGWSSKSDDDAAAYVLGSNASTIAGGWDDAEVAAMLRAHEADEGWRVGIGFDDADVRRLLATVDADGGGGSKHVEFDANKAKTVTCPKCQAEFLLQQ